MGDVEYLARAGIEKNRKFDRSPGITLTLSEAGIGSDRFDDILDRSLPGSVTRGNFKPLKRDDLRNILTKCH